MRRVLLSLPYLFKPCYYADQTGADMGGLPSRPSDLSYNILMILLVFFGRGAYLAYWMIRPS
jgi:hypothetical protein